jgi:hypothetical protein
MVIGKTAPPPGEIHMKRSAMFFFILLSVLASCASVPNNSGSKLGQPIEDTMKFDFADGRMNVVVQINGEKTIANSFDHTVVVFPTTELDKRTIYFSDGLPMQESVVTIEIPLVALHQLAEHFDIMHLRLTAE